MNYAALHIAFSEELQAEILTAELADYPFESFETQDGRLKAYIPETELTGCRAEVNALLARHGMTGRYEVIETRDWNAEWEKQFTPVDVDGRLRIRAPRHDPAPEGTPEILITPRMSFGTGHHATTCLMASFLLDNPMRGRRGLDMGSGTGVLAILAVKCGAQHVDAVDIDEWADASCRENLAANGVEERITPLRGDVERIAGRKYGFVLANINRNVLLRDMPFYAAALDAGGDLAMSGFLRQDIPVLTSRAEESGLTIVGTREREGWAMIHCRKTMKWFVESKK